MFMGPLNTYFEEINLPIFLFSLMLFGMAQQYNYDKFDMEILRQT